MTSDELRTVLGTNLRHMRVEAHMSQRSLAEAVGVSHAQINRIEKGLSSLPVDLLAKLSEALHQPPDLLLRPDLSSEPKRNLSASA